MEGFETELVDRVSMYLHYSVQSPLCSASLAVSCALPARFWTPSLKLYNHFLGLCVRLKVV